MDEITLSNGNVVRVERVPYAIGYDIMDKIPELRFPDEPVVEVKTMKGKSTETHPADKDSQEWKDYVSARKDVESARMAFGTYVLWQEGIIEWQLAGTDTWHSQPPQDYQMPRILADVGGFAPYLDNRRIAYVRYSVCQNMQDVLKLSGVVLNGMPLTEAEVDAAVEGFPSETPRQSNEETAA